MALKLAVLCFVSASPIEILSSDEEGRPSVDSAEKMSGKCVARADGAAGVFLVQPAMQRFQIDEPSARALMGTHGSKEDPGMENASRHMMRCLKELGKECALEGGPAKVVLGAVGWDIGEAVGRTERDRACVRGIFPGVNGRPLDALLGRHGFDVDRAIAFVTDATAQFIQGQEFVTESLEATQFLIDSDFDVDRALDRAEKSAQNMTKMAARTDDDADDWHTEDDDSKEECRDAACEICNAVLWTRGEAVLTYREIGAIKAQGGSVAERGRFECANDVCTSSHDVCQLCVLRWHRRPANAGHAKCPWCRGRLMASRSGYLV